MGSDPELTVRIEMEGGQSVCLTCTDYGGRFGKTLNDGVVKAVHVTSARTQVEELVSKSFNLISTEVAQ